MALSEQTTTEYTDDGNVTVPVGTEIFSVDGFGNVKAGPNELLPADLQQSSATWIGDFVYSSNSRRVYARSLVLREAGDPPDLALGRTGGTRPLGPPSEVTAAMVLGRFYMQGWTTGGTFNNGSVCIYGRAAETFTPTAQGASLSFAVTNVGTTTMRDAATFKPDGTFTLISAGGRADACMYNHVAQVIRTSNPTTGEKTAVWAEGGIRTLVTHGGPSDGVVVPPLVGPGIIILDDTNSRLYVRCSSGWKSVQLS